MPTDVETDVANLLRIRRLYLPVEHQSITIGSLFGEEDDGIIYRYGAMIGSDLDSSDEMLILKRDVIAPGKIPPNGIWVEVDSSGTQLVVLKRNFGGNILAPVEEFASATFRVKDKLLRIERKSVPDSEDIKLSIGYEKLR